MLLLLVPFVLHASEKGPKGTIRVGIFPFAPFNYLDKNGNAKGLNPDLLREIAKDEVWDVEFVPGSWAEGLGRLQSQEIDLIMSVAYSPERGDIMDFTYEPVAQLSGQIYVRPEGKSQKISDLSGQRIAVMRDDISGRNFIKTAEHFGVHCKILEFFSHADVFVAVQKGEADAGVAPHQYGQRHADTYALVPSTIKFSPFFIYFASKKGTQHELLSHLDAHLSLWKEDSKSVYYQALKHWIPDCNTMWAFPPWLLYSLVTAGLTALIFATFSFLLKKSVDRKTRELQLSEERFRLAMDATRDGLWDWDITSNTVYYSPGYWLMLGYKADLQPASVEVWMESIHPDDREVVLSTNYDCIENRCESFVVEYRMRTKTGHWKWIRGRGRAVRREENGHALRIIGTHVDIAERKHTEDENKKLQDQLIHSQKMEAIGTLAGGIAHDFNNILSAILGYAELAQAKLPPESSVTKDLNEVLTAGRRAATLVRQILAFGRQSATERIHLKPTHIVKEAITLLRPSLPSTITIKAHIGTETNTIIADPTQVHQILMNLCTNAFHAMEQAGGTLEITLKNCELSSEDLPSIPEMQPGQFVVLVISDTGTGIAPEIKHKIFDPYFSTKGIAKGTGMGLAIVHGIIVSYGGLITCESEPGCGTVFKVYFPAIEQEVVLDPQIAEPVLSGKEHILLVDDEEILVKLGRATLERLGYDVTVHTSSIEALSTFQNQPDRFDAVITDQTMPGMTGIDLARQILQINPNLPIILCTGYSSIISEEEVKALGIKGFILKPHTGNDLSILLRKVLDESKNPSC